MQIKNEVTDNKIYTYKGEMIIACGINKDAGGIFIKFNTLVSEFTSMVNNIYIYIYIWCPKKRKQNDIKHKGAIHTFLTVGTYSGNYNVQQILTYFLFQRCNVSPY